MAKKLKCPECGYTDEPVKNETVYCTGRRTEFSAPHKKARKMV
jgi:hypothetical protein